MKCRIFLTLATRSNVEISASNPKTGSEMKKCHVGKELFNAGETFFMFSPQEGKRMAGMFERLLQSGIQQRRRVELHGLSYSVRVQDHVRGKSWTSFAKEDVPLEKLRMQGKILTVFLLWTFCLVLSNIVFASEWFIAQKTDCESTAVAKLPASVKS